MGDFISTIPKELVTHIIAMCGEQGARWFEELPAIIAQLERKWKVSVGSPFPGIEYNFVAEARSERGEDVVVKIAPPFHTTEIFGEAKYLDSRKGNGTVRLLEVDREAKAILLERAFPGKALHEEFASSPLDCLEPAIDVLKRIVQPPPTDMSDVVTLDQWFDNFGRYQETEFPAQPASQAIEIYHRLTRDRDRLAYIHGDYHLGNVVSASREPFLAIDPKGIVGHIGYDIAVFLINFERWQRNDPDVEHLVQRAVTTFANAFALSETEVREWVFVHMVIGAWWNFEDMPDHYDPEVAMPAIWHL